MENRPAVDFLLEKRVMRMWVRSVFLLSNFDKKKKALSYINYRYRGKSPEIFTQLAQTPRAIVSYKMSDSAWQTHTGEDGQIYYYNNVTQESTWEKPESLMTPLEVRASDSMHNHTLPLLTLSRKRQKHTLERV